MNLFAVFLSHPLIPLFIVANLAIGYWAHRKAKVGSFEDYAMASRNLLTGVLVMTFVSRGTLSTPFFAFHYGMLSTLFLISYILSFLFVRTFIAPFLVYFQESMTLGDVMGKLYGRVARLVTGTICSVVILIDLTSQIRGIASISKYLLNIDPSIAILCFGGVVVV